MEFYEFLWTHMRSTDFEFCWKVRLCLHVCLFVCLSVCLFVSRITQKLMRGILWWIMPLVQDWSLDLLTSSPACYHWAMDAPLNYLIRGILPYHYIKQLIIKSDVIAKVYWKCRQCYKHHVQGEPVLHLISAGTRGQTIDKCKNVSQLVHLSNPSNGCPEGETPSTMSLYEVTKQGTGKQMKWNEWCFRLQFCTCKAILSQGQPELMS